MSNCTFPISSWEVATVHSNHDEIFFYLIFSMLRKRIKCNEVIIFCDYNLGINGANRGSIPHGFPHKYTTSGTKLIF